MKIPKRYTGERWHNRPPRLIAAWFKLLPENMYRKQAMNSVMAERILAHLGFHKLRAKG